MKIGGLQKLTLIDFPSKIACVIFFIGCNFRCPFCYSSELVLPEKIKKQSIIKEEEILEFLKERKDLLEGVVFCGGEPTLNKDLPELAKKVKKLGYLIKLDTNGSNFEVIKKMIEDKLIDYLAMDIKAPLYISNQKEKFNNILKSKTKYQEIAGVKIDIEQIKKSINFIKNSGIDYEFRTTLVPNLLTKSDVIQIVQDISPAKKFYLQNFRPEKTLDPSFVKIKPYSQKDLLEIKEAISGFFEVCEIRA